MVLRTPTKKGHDKSKHYDCVGVSTNAAGVSLLGATRFVPQGTLLGACCAAGDVKQKRQRTDLCAQGPDSERLSTDSDDKPTCITCLSRGDPPVTGEASLSVSEKNFRTLLPKTRTQLLGKSVLDWRPEGRQFCEYMLRNILDWTFQAIAILVVTPRAWLKCFSCRRITRRH